MEKVKKSKFLLVAILMGLMICCMSLLSACYTVWYLHIIAGGGYSVDKIIYTDDAGKYLAGRTIVEKLECGSTILNSGASSGIWILETDIVNKYDIVLTTQSMDYIDEDSGKTEKGGYYPIGYAADMGYYVMNDTWSYTLLTNSHIFSGITGHYTPGGDYDCTNTNCTGHYDSWDGCMGCHRWTETPWTVDTPKTNTEAMEHFNLCPACHSIVETVNADGTYTYTSSVTCSCKGWFYHDGTWQREYKSWLQINEQGIVSSFRFDELVLDGYDFGVLYDFITTYDYDKVGQRFFLQRHEVYPSFR